jgi:uncharacterized RDD family membrane protein YckC
VASARAAEGGGRNRAHAAVGRPIPLEAPAGAPTLEPASLIRRLLSLCYEALLLAAILVVAAIPFVVLAGTARTPALKLALQLYLLLVAGSYFSYCWVHGQTLAMRTWGIRLVNTRGEPIGFNQALLRFVLALAGYSLGLVTLLWALIDADRQFLHDRLAGTRIVRTAPASPSLDLPDQGDCGEQKDGSGEDRAQDRRPVVERAKIGEQAVQEVKS